MAATIAQMPLTTIMTIKAGVKRAWETMGMRVHLQSTADFTSIASAATDVREFMAKRGGRAAAAGGRRSRPGGPGRWRGRLSGVARPGRAAGDQESAVKVRRTKRQVLSDLARRVGVGSPMHAITWRGRLADHDVHLHVGLEGGLGRRPRRLPDWWPCAGVPAPRRRSSAANWPRGRPVLRRRVRRRRAPRRRRRCRRRPRRRRCRWRGCTRAARPWMASWSSALSVMPPPSVRLALLA